MWNVCATRSHRVRKSHKGRRMKNMFLVFSSITHTCRSEAKTTHAHTRSCHRYVIPPFWVCFQNTICWAKSSNAHRWKLTWCQYGSVPLCSLQQMSLAVWYTLSLPRSDFHTFFHKSTLSNRTPCQRGEACRFVGGARSTPFSPSPAGINGREFLAVNSPTVRCSEGRGQVSPPSF